MAGWWLLLVAKKGMQDLCCCVKLPCQHVTTKKLLSAQSLKTVLAKHLYNSGTISIFKIGLYIHVYR